MNRSLNRSRFIRDLLWLFVFFGITAAIFRMWFGLGPTTNLTDEVPWGLWKVLNMIAGVALSTSGFTVGFLVYVLKLEKFKKLLRPAILIAFLGYGSSCLALLFDIGLPTRFWHPFFMWNEHSFLFEVFWCVSLYFTITAIELLPNILEKYKAQKIISLLHKIAAGIVIIGISLSSLHHSSLGSLFLVSPTRLYPLWYSSLLPVYFFISAAGCGIMFLIFVRIIYAKYFNPEPVFGSSISDRESMTCSINGEKVNKSVKEYGKDINILSSLAIIAASILGLYLVIKIYYLISSGKIDLLLLGNWESWVFSIELFFTAVIPIILVSLKRVRFSPYGLGTAAFLSSLGLAMNRLNVGIFGYFRSAEATYFPSFTEWALCIGVIAGAALIFIFLSENFSIFDTAYRKDKISIGVFRSAFDSISRVWQTALNSSIHRISLLGVVALPVAFVLMYPPFQSNNKIDIIPAYGLDISRTILVIDGDHENLKVEFAHFEHQQRLGAEKSCVNCHHFSLPNDKSTPCSRCHKHMLEQTEIFNHVMHTSYIAEENKIGGLNPQNYTCLICHQSEFAKTSGNAKKCIECHKQDINLDGLPTMKQDFKYAAGYMFAMHNNCIPCHAEQKLIVDKPELDQCKNCHHSLSTGYQAEMFVQINRPSAFEGF